MPLASLTNVIKLFTLSPPDLTVANPAAVLTQEVKVHDGALRGRILKVGVAVEHADGPSVAVDQAGQGMVHIPACERLVTVM